MELKFTSISEQVAQALRREIEGRTWINTLPGERKLAARFQVSRKTLRRALAELRREGLLRTRVNEASFIRHTGQPAPVTTRIALLLPTPLESARPFTVLWVNRLMAALQDRGLYLEILHGSKYFGTRAARSLGLLTASHPARCWILAGSNRSLQRWFVDSGIPTLVAGSAHDGIALPSVDVDHRALCRHAAAQLFRQGHRRVAIFLDRAGRAGDAESEAGFREGAAALGGEPIVTGESQGNDGSPESTVSRVRKLLALPSPPTGWLISNSRVYLTATGYLGSIGLKVPDDVSLICRDEDPFTPFIYPTPSRYTISPTRFAACVNQALRRIESGDGGAFSSRIMPDFVAGASVGPAGPRPDRRTLLTPLP